MRTLPTNFKAVLLFRGEGTILYANPPALEQTGWMGGRTLGDLGTVDTLLGRIFTSGEDREPARSTLRRALDLARRRGSLLLRLEMPFSDLHPHQWEVRVTHRPEFAEETFAATFQPSALPVSDTPDQHRSQLLRTAAEHARQILDQALGGGDLPELEGASVETTLLARRLTRAREVLATLDLLTEVPVDRAPHRPLEFG